MHAERRTVLILGARAPVALDHARRFAAHGWRVVAGDSISCRITSWSRAVEARVLLPPARTDTDAYARALQRAIREHDVRLVLPTCEESFYVSHVRSRLPDDVRVCVAGFDTLRRLHSKWRFLELATAAGVAVPESALVADLAQAREWADGCAVVLKPEYSRFGVHVRLHPQGIPGDAPAFEVPGNWVVQRLCTGRELCSYSVADRGRLLAHASYRPLYRLRRSSSFYFEPCDTPATRDFAERLVAALGYTGQISFDWIENDAGELHVLECNPRAISAVHLFAPGDDLPGALAGEAQACVVPSSPSPRMIAAVMASAGLASAAAAPGRWWHDWRRARDVIAVRDDRWPAAGSVLDLCSYVGLALRQRCSLRQAATHDCEWDGAPIGDSA